MNHTEATPPMLTRRLVLRGGTVLGVAAAIGATTVACASNSAPAAPATIIHNGKVFVGTPEGPVTEAVAIASDGTILRTGTSAELLALAGPTTARIDAAGATVMAGIVDGHMHPLGAAQSSLTPSLGNADLTVEALQAKIQGFLDESRGDEPDGWLVVSDWSPVGLLPPGTVAHRAMLDALATKRPILLQGSDFHNSLVNSRALALAGVTASTPNPAGGEIVRGDRGEATGLLKDNAQSQVQDVIPSPSADLMRTAAEGVLTQMLAKGITSFMDAAAAEDSVDLYADMAAAGVLKQRVTAALVIDPELAAKPKDAIAYVTGIAGEHTGNTNLRFGVAKVFLDGVIEFPAHTAALLEPYLDATGKPTDNAGDLYVDGPTFGALATALDAEGWQMHSHAIGDRAVRTALDGYAAAVAANGNNDRRHTITHLQLVHPDDYARFAQTGTIASMQLQWAKRNSFTLDALAPYIGPDRFARLYPSKSLQSAGAKLAGGSDWPVDPLNPFEQIETAIDRIGSGATVPEPLGTDQAMDRADVLRMHTVSSAHQLHLDDTGTLEPGRRADVIVLDRDLLACPVKEIHDTTVRYTLIAGKVVYDASSPPPMVAAPSSHATELTGGTIRATGFHQRHAQCCGGRDQRRNPPTPT